MSSSHYYRRGYNDSDFTYGDGPESRRPKHRDRRHSFDYGENPHYYEDDSSRGRSRSRARDFFQNLRHGNVRGAIDSLPSGLTGHSPSPTRHSYRSRSSSNSPRRARSVGSGSYHRNLSPNKRQAIGAAVAAGAAEALRLSHDRGPWMGEKGARVASAALVAAAIDASISDDSGRKAKRHVAESMVGSLLANKAVYGSSSSPRRH